MTYSVAGATTPKYKTWTNVTTTWGAAANLPAYANAQQSIIKASPTRNEMTAGVVNNAGVLHVFRWNGTSWSDEWSATVGTDALARFDITYEEVSGKAVVFYSHNTSTNQLAYRKYNGTSWTAEATYNTTQADVLSYVRVETRPGTNEIGLVWVDVFYNEVAAYYDGTNNVFAAQPSAALTDTANATGINTQPNIRSFDLAFEQVSRKLLICWGVGGVPDLSCISRTAGVSGVWGTKTVYTGFFEEPTDMQLKAEPGTNYIAYANLTDVGSDADAGVWDGTTWGSITNFDTTVNAALPGSKGVAVEWVQSGGQSRAVVTYDDSAAAGVDWLYFNKNTTTWSAIQTDYTGGAAISGTDDAEENLYRNPSDASQLTFLIVDSNSDLFTRKLDFDGTNLTWSATNVSGNAHDTGIAALSSWAAAFAYNRFIPGTLSVDIVDASNATVVAPSLAMSSSPSSEACQTSTGTLGTSTQKIRVTNGTTTPGWSLSIAATAGATGNWSGGIPAYDFNDSAGSPAGCGDGADADSLAGQLSVNPSVGTVTPQAACSATGITKGTSSAFNQAVVDNITLLTASASTGTGCYWDFTGVSLSQKIPLLQAAGSYSIPMTITVVAN